MSSEPLSILNPARAPAPGLRPALDRFFEISLYLLVATGFFTLAGTGRLDALSLVVVSTALFWRGYLLLRDRRVVIPERWTSYLTLLYVAFYVFDFFFLSASFVTASIHLVLFSMVVKIFSVQRERDHVYLAVLSFLAVLSAAVLTVDTAFLGAFCLFLLLAAATFISMEIRHSAQAADDMAPAPAVARPHRRMVGALSLTAMAIVIAIVLGGGALFFVLPRLSAGYLSAYAPRNDFVSGFSDTVQLGQIGVIKQSSNVVMHVEIEQGRADIAELKLRGVALSLFDGRMWSNPPGIMEPRAPAATGNGFRFDLLRSQMRVLDVASMAELQRSSRPLLYRVTMEPVGTNVIFLAGVPVSMQGRMRMVGVDGNGSVFNLDRSRMTDSYSALSLLPSPQPEQLRGAGAYPADISLNYLQLPNVDRRIPALAAEITAKASTPYARAAAIELYLRTRYGYSLQMVAPPDSDPLAYFLFERKQGHCEYFASAMAIMLRTLGIPARLVNGFRGGEYNDVTGNYIIRGRDAHSWVEAFIPGYGWATFDPTPADPRDAVGGLHRVSLYLDALGEFWREWVINYDFLHQQNLTFSAVMRGRSYSDRTRLWMRRQYFALLRGAGKAYRGAAGGAGRTWTIAVVLVLLAAIAFPGLLKIARERRLTRQPQRAPRAAASLWYARLCHRLARQGLRKTPAQTPGEFVAAIADGPLREKVERFTRHYQRARFGHSGEDARRLPELYEEITR
jgi:transglutaminase-like putative cysteine protease